MVCTFRKINNYTVEGSATMIQYERRCRTIKLPSTTRLMTLPSVMKNVCKMHRGKNTILDKKLLKSGAQAPRNICFDYIEVGTMQKKRQEYRCWFKKNQLLVICVICVRRQHTQHVRNSENGLPKRSRGCDNIV